MVRARVRVLAGFISAVLTACGASAGAGHPLPPSSAARAAVWSPNLIVNGDAEAGNATINGYDAVTIPGWIPSGLPTVVAYGAPEFPNAKTPGPPNRGHNFFSGGALGDSALAQSVDVSAAAAAIDAGSVQAKLSGWLGGYGTQADHAQLAATFRSASGKSLGTASIGPVTPQQRKNVTAFLVRQAIARVPQGTRSIGVVLQNTRYDGAYDDAYADDLSLQLSTAIAAPPAPTPPPARVHHYDHIFQTMFENSWYPQIVGNTSQAPYINSLMAKGALLTNAFALAHPSDPNYVAMVAGSTYTLDSDDWASTTFDVKHLADSVESSGRSWRVYMESANGPCDKTLHGYYYPDDSPYIYFGDVRNDAARCKSRIVPISQLATDLASSATTPDYVWIAPDDCDDMEACGISAGDKWLQSIGKVLFNSPAWKQGNSILIVTWDEDDYKHDQHVPAFIYGGHVKAGYRSPVFYTHYSVLRTIEASFGLPTLTDNDLFANPINDVWTQ